MKPILLALSAATGLTACASGSGPAPATGAEKNSANPLLTKWTGPYGGVPAFDRVRVKDFQPALLSAMDLFRGEIAAIAKNPAAPSFDNTIAALEDAGRVFGDVGTLFGVWSSSMSDPAFQAIERELAPKLAAFDDELTQNAALFARIEAVHDDAATKAKLTPEQQRLIWLHYTNFVRAGAKLDAQAKQRTAAINQRLATLYTEFSQSLLAEEEKIFVELSTEADLAGLPESIRASAAAEGEARGKKGKWIISNTRSAMEPFLTFSSRRDLREKVWTNYVNRGDNGDANDNNLRIAEILKLRAERAKLLGFPTHAHWRLEDSMAKTPERAMALMEAVWKPAVARVREEVRDMQAIADKELGAAAKIKLAPWDYRFYAEKVRRAKYDLDENEITPYLQLDKLRDALFFVAGELFDFGFTPVQGLPVYHPDVRVYEVKTRATNRLVGLWYFDPYARAGKQSGAWMNAYRNQERMKGEVVTIVSNNSNFMKGKPGEPVSISWEDASTLFHEFGHALHGLASNVTYPTVSGTSVARDFVEFPSQLLEHWLDTPEVLGRFALHVQTGKPIPDALVKKIKNAATFNSGFGTVEYLASALVDLKLHLAGEAPIDPDAFEKQTLRALGMPEEIVMRHRTPHFGHVFSSDGYSAGYYSYLWADTLTADAFEAFREGKGAYDKNVAAKLRQHVFSVGNTVDPADGYRAFRGRDPDIAALMRKRGFPVPAEQAKSGGGGGGAGGGR